MIVAESNKTKKLVNPRRLIAKRQRVSERRFVATQEQGILLFEHQARKEFGVSAQEFLSRWDQGTYQNCMDEDEKRKAQRLAMLIPFVRRTLV